MARNYAALPHDYLGEMELLTDAEFGRLCRALLKYSSTGEMEELNGNERVLFPRVKMQEDRFQSSYNELSESRRIAGEKGAEARWQKDGKNSKAMPANGKNGNTETNTKTNTETNTETKTKLKPENEQRARAFEAFWKAYPRKVGKQAAEKAFAKVPESAFPLILSAIELQRCSPQWTKEGGQYIPNPTTWLNQGRWEDEPTQAEKTTGNVFLQLLQRGDLDE